MVSIAIAFGIGALVALAALVLRRRSAVDAPTQKVFAAPTQIDRSDFPTAQHQWMVAVFTSETCHVCADMLGKAKLENTAQDYLKVIQIEEAIYASSSSGQKIQLTP